MAVNYKPYVSWGVWGGSSAKERANYFVSWGIFLVKTTVNWLIRGYWWNYPYEL